MANRLRKHIEDTVALTDQEFDFIQGYFQPKRFRKGQTVIGKEYSASQDYFVLSGLLRSYYSSVQGETRILQFASGSR